MGVRIEREGPAAILVFDWPEARNAMGPEETKIVAAALSTIADDAEVCGVVVTGAGSAFCAGGNLKGTASREGMDPEERRKIVYSAFQSMIRGLVAVPVPTVAAVDGPAIGMGMDIALACDSRFIGPNGWCMQGWGRVGFVPGTGGELFLRLKAPDILWRILETQPKIDGAMAETLRIGESSGEISARDRAVARIKALAVNSREPLEAYVRLSRSDLRDRLEAYLDAAAREQMKLLASPTLKERIARVLPQPKS